MISTAQFVRIIANRFFYVTSPTYLTFDNLFQVVSEDTSPEKQQESEEMQEKEDIKEKKEQKEKQEKKEEIVKVVKSEMALVSCIASWYFIIIGAFLLWSLELFLTVYVCISVYL